MIRGGVLVLVLVAAPLAGMAALGPDEPRRVQRTDDAGSQAPEPSTGSAGGSSSSSKLTIDGSELPASTGWFLVPILADEGGAVNVEIRHRLDNRDDHAKIAVPMMVGHETTLAFPSATGLDEPHDAEVQGRQLTCCPTPFEDGLAGMSDLGGWYGTSPETPLVVGMAASGWTEGDVLFINVTSYELDLRAGTVRTGTGVHAVDLFEASRPDTSVYVGDTQVPRGSEDVHRRWTAQDTGLVSVAWDLEDGGGQLRLTLPNGTSVDAGLGPDTRGHLETLSGPGAHELSFVNASREDPEENRAFALFADVELPYRDLELGQRST